MVDDPRDIEEGDAQIQLTAEPKDKTGQIVIPNYLIKTDNGGRDYVMIQGSDGLLKKQRIVTGKTYYGYAIEVVEGLSESDKIAFPYPKNAVEGAPTKEVDMLEENG